MMRPVPVSMKRTAAFHVNGPVVCLPRKAWYCSSVRGLTFGGGEGDCDSTAGVGSTGSAAAAAGGGGDGGGGSGGGGVAAAGVLEATFRDCTESSTAFVFGFFVFARRHGEQC